MPLQKMFAYALCLCMFAIAGCGGGGGASTSNPPGLASVHVRFKLPNGSGGFRTISGPSALVSTVGSLEDVTTNVTETMHDDLAAWLGTHPPDVSGNFEGDKLYLDGLQSRLLDGDPLRIEAFGIESAQDFKEKVAETFSSIVNELSTPSPTPENPNPQPDPVQVAANLQRIRKVYVEFFLQ